jgi:hypothetical protein
MRRIIGTEKLNEQVKEQSLQLQKIISLLQYSVLDEAEVKNLATYAKCANLVSLMAPMDVPEQQFIRVGTKSDGGYVMLNAFANIKAAYSFGIGTDVSWDLAIAEKGIPVWMYDHTVESLPTNHHLFHFGKTGVCGLNRNDSRLRPLADLMAQNQHQKETGLILKLDVEGAEWDVLDFASSSTLSQFSQIAIELHNLTAFQNGKHYENMVRVLEKLSVTHQSVHVHANIVDSPLWIGDKVLPTQLEVTFARRSDYNNQFLPCSRTFPTKLDYPWCSGVPELKLGRFS